LRQGKVDLAIVRPDVLLPGNGLTVAILREEAVIVVAPAASKIEGFSGLAGKRLGVVTHHEADLPVLTAIAAHYDLSPPAITLVPLGLEEVERR
jgi:ABC-type nitrate/sulfonate/bicarbonate transport system substrate-binding protein